MVVNHNCGFDFESIDNHESVQFVTVLGNNRITVGYEGREVTPDMINLISQNCTETPHICEIKHTSGVTKVEYEF